MRSLDNYIYEFTVKDEQPPRLGKAVLKTADTIRVGSYQTIEQIYTVGEKPLEPGARIMVARQLQADGGRLQFDDPAGDNYLSASASNPAVKLGKTTVPLVGMHGGFRAPAPMPTFLVEQGTLRAGDTVTIVYGDRSGGGEGRRQQTFATDQAMLPIYIDHDGGGRFLTPEWPSYAIAGGEAEGVSAVVPSIVEPGEPFDLSIRWEDFVYNRASGRMPAAEITLNGKHFRSFDAGGPAIRLIEDIELAEEGIYRFKIAAADGKIEALSNPVWVRKNSAYRLYWGETHTHTGMAEGQGSLDRSYAFARDDARLDFSGLSEHDIWLTDAEWEAMRRAVVRYSEPGKFIAFLGYEWTVRRQWGGHHNVFFRTPQRRERVGAQIAPSLSELYQGLRERYDTNDVVIIPHAPPGGRLAPERPGYGEHDRNHVDARHFRVVRQLLSPPGLPRRLSGGVRRPPRAPRIQLHVEPPAGFVAEPVRRIGGRSGARENRRRHLRRLEATPWLRGHRRAAHYPRP